MSSPPADVQQQVGLENKKKGALVETPKPLEFCTLELLRNGVDCGDQGIACESRVMDAFAAIVIE